MRSTIIRVNSWMSELPNDVCDFEPITNSFHNEKLIREYAYEQEPKPKAILKRENAAYASYRDALLENSSVRVQKPTYTINAVVESIEAADLTWENEMDSPMKEFPTCPPAILLQPGLRGSPLATNSHNHNAGHNGHAPASFAQRMNATKGNDRLQALTGQPKRKGKASIPHYVDGEIRLYREESKERYPESKEYRQVTEECFKAHGTVSSTVPGKKGFVSRFSTDSTAASFLQGITDYINQPEPHLINIKATNTPTLHTIDPTTQTPIHKEIFYTNPKQHWDRLGLSPKPAHPVFAAQVIEPAPPAKDHTQHHKPIHTPPSKEQTHDCPKSLEIDMGAAKAFRTTRPLNPSPFYPPIPLFPYPLGTTRCRARACPIKHRHEKGPYLHDGKLRQRPEGGKVFGASNPPPEVWAAYFRIKDEEGGGIGGRGKDEVSAKDVGVVRGFVGVHYGDVEGEGVN